MTIYQSQERNNDPTPFAGGRSQRISPEEYLDIPSEHRLAWTYNPRPEYELLVNPILVAFLEDDGQPAILDRARDYLLYMRQHPGHAAGLFEAQHIEHARRVLSKLVAVYS